MDTKQNYYPRVFGVKLWHSCPVVWTRLIPLQLGWIHLAHNFRHTTSARIFASWMSQPWGFNERRVVICMHVADPSPMPVLHITAAIPALALLPLVKSVSSSVSLCQNRCSLKVELPVNYPQVLMQCSEAVIREIRRGDPHAKFY
jgi:hypothetical protein